jgi:hypothetical protein
MMKFFSLGKLVVGVSIAASLAILLGVFNYFNLAGFSEKFVDRWEAASGLSVTITGFELNSLTGNGAIKKLVIRDRDDAFKPLIELKNIKISTTIFSNVWGPLKIKKFENSDGEVSANIIDTGGRIKTFNTWLRRAAASPNLNDEKLVRFEDVNFGQGIMIIGAAEAGSDYERIAEFPKTSLSLASDPQSDRSDIDEIRSILIELTSQALEATAYPLIR